MAMPRRVRRHHSTPSIRRPLIHPLFHFRVWIEQDKSRQFSAHCLETGAVATADDLTTVISIIEDVLASEASLAIDSEDFANLYASPAPPAIWFKWNAMAQKHEPEKKMF